MRRFETLICAAALALIAAGNASAQVYPSRPITIIAPFPPGGPSDALARILSGPLQAALGHGLRTGAQRWRASLANSVA